MGVELDKKIKTALDETRLLILGSQILLGFQFSGTFQPQFEQLGRVAQNLAGVALLLMVTVIGFLISPSMENRLVDRGDATERMLRSATSMAALALLPFAASLGVDFFIVYQHLFGWIVGVILGGLLFGVAVSLWYVSQLYLREKLSAREPSMSPDQRRTSVSLHNKIEQLLTEARIVLPGVQALFGFQLSVIFTQAFAELPEREKVVHAASLGMVALAILIIMAPAAYHRITFRGEDSEAFLAIGSRFVVGATVPLAIGIAGDVYVAITKITDNPGLGLVAALGVALLLVVLWYARPLYLRSFADQREVPHTQRQA